ncbi:heavy-metal-associated domain-containing protein [candidate division WOR-3 bacterium]|nr:heavy-metal-associated domain-containing protein [candidate division WOR-3 bacterium]
MSKKIVHIPGIRGHYSILTLREELCKLEGVEDVKVDITTREARISWKDPATWEDITTRLVELGFPHNSS